MFNLYHTFIEYVTAEFILIRLHKSNGGSVIALRSIWTASILFAFILILINLLDPDRTFEFSSYDLQTQIIEKLPWFGAFFASVYVALYARFSSQWTYMANLYNQIKQTEASGKIDKNKLAEWKAGFIEDAQTLHLIMKPTFASIICVWGADELVKEKFIQYTPGGSGRYEKIMEQVKEVCEAEREKYV